MVKLGQGEDRVIRNLNVFASQKRDNKAAMVNEASTVEPCCSCKAARQTSYLGLCPID